jgi:hypothetical protein
VTDQLGSRHQAGGPGSYHQHVDHALEHTVLSAALTPHVVALAITSLYYATVVGWLGGSIPVLENQLALLRSNLELPYRGARAA